MTSMPPGAGLVFPPTAQIGGGAGVILPSTTANYPITVNVNRTLIDAGSGVLMLSRAKTGHVDGCEQVVIIPANQRTKIYVGADINLTGCAIDATTRRITSFDPTLETWIVLACRNGTIEGSYRSAVAQDNAAAIVVSATVDLNSDSTKLTVIWSKPVDPQTIAGLSLTGVSQTIASISSRDGTTTIYTLSAPFVGTEVGNFVIGSSRTAVDLNGNPVATGTTSLTVRSGLVSLASWVEAWEAKKGLLPQTPSANFTSWTGQQAGYVLAQGAAGHATIASDLLSVAFAGTTQYLTRASTPLSAGNGDFAIYVRGKRPNTGATLGCLVDFADGSSAKRCPIFLHVTSGVQCDIYDGTLNPTLNDSFTTGPGYHDIFLERSGTTFSLTVDGRTPVTTTSNATVAALSNIYVGSELAPTEFSPLTGNVACLAFKNGGTLSSAEKSAIRTYAAANYP